MKGDKNYDEYDDDDALCCNDQGGWLPLLVAGGSRVPRS